MDISVFYVEILQLSLFLLASSVIEFNYIIIIIKEVKITVMDYAFVFVKSRAYSLGRRSDKLKFEGAVLAIASAMNLDRKLWFPAMLLCSLRIEHYILPAPWRTRICEGIRGHHCQLERVLYRKLNFLIRIPPW